jgi:hypothetical protein
VSDKKVGGGVGEVDSNTDSDIVVPGRICGDNISTETGDGIDDSNSTSGIAGKGSVDGDCDDSF